jgi:hypothetical protein
MFQMNTVEIFSWTSNIFAQTLKVSLHPEKQKPNMIWFLL